MSASAGRPTTSATEAHRARLDDGHARFILTVVCASQFVVILDASIVNVALPSVQRDLGFSASGLAWVVNGYLLAFAGFMLLGGRAADLFGQRRMLVAGLALFSAASLADGLAITPSALVAARVAQGIGAAMLAPATLAVINTNFTSQHDRARAFGAWSAAGGAGGMAGAVAGGIITTGLSWRWVFLINVPIGAMLIVAAAMSLTAGPDAKRGPLDLAGAVTGTAGLAALIYGMMGGTVHGWASAKVIGPTVAGSLLLARFAVIERRATLPMMPLRLLRMRTVAVGNGMLLLFGGIPIALWYFSSLLLQNVLGYSALRSGLGQTPAAVMFVVIARLAAGLLPRAGARSLLLAACACFLAGFGWFAQAHAGTSYATGVLGPTLLIASGIGLAFPTLMAVATAGAPDADAGIIGGLASTASQLGGSVGLAVLATVASEERSVATGYDLVFLVAAGLAVLLAVGSVLLPRRLPCLSALRSPRR